MDNEKYKNINKNKAMKEIAIDILKICGQPMHYKEITGIMLNEVGYCSQGKSPWATLNSLIGRDSGFSKYRGIVALKEWKHPINDAPKTLEKPHYPNSEKENFKVFIKTLEVEVPRIISKSKMEEPVGRGIINEDSHDNYPKTYTMELDRTK